MPMEHAMLLKPLVAIITSEKHRQIDFKGLDLIGTVPEELWTEVHNTAQEAVNKTILKKKKCKQAK